jgi:hypothetical protein
MKMNSIKALLPTATARTRAQSIAGEHGQRADLRAVQRSGPAHPAWPLGHLEQVAVKMSNV